MSDIKEYTNREIGIILEEIQNDVKRLNKYIEGNGKKGLLDRMNDVEMCSKGVADEVGILMQSRQAMHTRVIDIVWKVGTAVVLCILGIERFNK